MTSAHGQFTVWRKPSRSGSGGGGNSNCLEAAAMPDAIAIRDSKLPTTGDFPVIVLRRKDWPSFLNTIVISR